MIYGVSSWRPRNSEYITITFGIALTETYMVVIILQRRQEPQQKRLQKRVIKL